MKPNKSNRKYWFSADIHDAHTNCIHLTQRPFKNIEEMMATIITNFNKKIGLDDVLYLLGDVSLGKKESWENFLDSLLCKNVILVLGNHDRWASIPKDKILMAAEVIRLRTHGRILLLSHYPYRCSWFRAFWKRLHPAVISKKRPKDTGLWLLHGHDHRKTPLCDYHPRQINVGVDAHNFNPVSIDDIIRIIQQQENGNGEHKRYSH